MKILLVEDDEILVANLAANLASQNYLVESAADGKRGWEYAQATQYDLIVLDVNLPELDGISLCRRLRHAHYEGAILLLTAKADSRYKVLGLDAGADDYVVKPCPIEELSARIRALLRRPQGVTSTILYWGALQLDPSTCQVRFAEQDISLSPKEYGLLELFLRNPQRVFSSAMLLERLWGFDEMPGEETIRTHIKRLRRKLKHAGADEAIENIYGMGYRLMPPPETEPLQANTAPDSGEATTPSVNLAPQTTDDTPQIQSGTVPAAISDARAVADATPEAAARAAAAAALGQFSDVIASRLAVLDKAAIALDAASLSDELQQQAQQAAHKLAGSLGMFGLADGSALSRNIEVSLQQELAQIDPSQTCEWIRQLHQTLETIFKAPPQTPEVDPVNDSEQMITQADRAPLAAPSLPLLLIISTDSTLRIGLVAIAQNTLQIIHAEDFQQAQQQLSQQRPDTILLDMATFPNDEARQPFLIAMATNHPNLPVLALTSQDTFETRLEITRCCRCTFLPGSTPALQILDTALELCQGKGPSTPHVLAVDDDPIVLKSLEQQLSPWGMQVTTLEDPRQLWDVLPQLNPDLLMLDVEMPHVEGIELCQVIRSDHYWSHLPVLFLTACRDTETVLRLYRAGADDYVAKPFTDSELIARILNRLGRNRLTQQLVTVDPTTGLMTEQQALRDIHRNFTLAQRHRQPYCLTMIAVESPGLQGNARQSLLNNQVVCEIAKLLSQRLRQEDIVAQAAPNVFLLGMYGIYRQQAERRLETLLQELHKSTSKVLGESALQLSFKVGLAAAPEEGENISILRRSAEANLNEIIPSLSS